MARILVIDDDRIQRLVASQALKRAGHEVIEANDGAQGLECARTQHPDLVICDVVMPGMNGYQFVTALRQEEGIAGIPVMMLTSMAERAHVRVGMNSGADDYLPKPFSFDELNEAVCALLAKRRSLQEGLINSMNTSFVAALDEQRESLATQYERRLVEQINARWERGEKIDAEVRYEHAIVLKADILGPLNRQASSGTAAAADVRRTYDAARDALHLFNPAHLLPAGNDLVAIYADDADVPRVPARVRALRASFALLKALSSLRREAAGDATPAANIVIHVGPVTVLQVSDPLHGGPDSTLATGESMQELHAMGDLVRNAPWAIGASPNYIGAMAGHVVTGRSAQAEPAGGGQALDVIEIVSLR